ncbi:MAG: hypothetical protein WCB31_13595 [Nitrososphaeraceae archaeon]
MTDSNNRMIVFASILGAILATSILALNPSTITNAQAMSYGSEDYDDRHSYGDQYGDDSNYYQDDNRYSYDKKDSKSYGDIQKINCRNSNVNVNGVDVTEIPHDNTALGAANEGGPEAANTENGNGLADRINFDRNLVNVCVNANDNEQLKVELPQGPSTINPTNVYTNVGETNDRIFTRDFGSAVANCDPGDTALSGSFEVGQIGIPEPGLLPAIPLLISSEPLATHTGWNITVFGINSGNGFVTPDVECFDNPPLRP